MIADPTIRLWEPSIEDHAMLLHAQRLYESALDADERIPWVWIERSLIERDAANGWRKHLLLASIDQTLAGLVYGAFISGFGGYLCYVAIDPRFRKLGLATKLYHKFFDQMAIDASAANEALPFVLWESYRPTSDDGPEAHAIWQARVRLFDRVGGLWVEGLEIQTPNFDGSGPPTVPMQVFLKPMQEPAESFNPERLRAIVAELLEGVYGQDPGDPLYEATFANAGSPRLVSAAHCQPVLPAVCVPALNQPTKIPPGMVDSNTSHSSI